MASSQPLEIKVIYSSSSRRGSRGKAAGALRVFTGTPAGRSKSWARLGVLNLIVAATLCYGIWWRVDPYLYLTMVMRTPVVDVDLDEVATQMFGIPPADLAAIPKPYDEDVSPSAAPDQPKQGSRFEDETARVVIVGSVYIWLTLATIACCMVALSGGAALGRAGGGLVRAFGVIATCGGLLALGYGGYRLWGEFRWEFRPTDLRTGMSLLVLLTAVAGILGARRARRLLGIAAVLLIVSGAGTVGGLYLGAQAGAIPLERSTPMFLVTVFIIHSLYGWILLPVSLRIAR